jgi:hypothetical protein
MKNLIVIRPKTTEQTGFRYIGLESLAELIKFVGKMPTIQMNTSNVPELSFKKKIVKPGDLVFRNSFGEVTHTLTEQEVLSGFEIVKEIEFSETDINKVQERVKVIKEKTKVKK